MANNELDPEAYYDAGDGLLIRGTGEIVELPEAAKQGGLIAYLARRRADADAQAKGWETSRRAIDRALLALPDIEALAEVKPSKLQAGDLIVSRRQRNNPSFDVAGFKEEILGMEITLTEARGVIDAAMSFSEARLPAPFDAIASKFAASSPSKPWIETAPILKVAPAGKAPEKGPA